MYGAGSVYEAEDPEMPIQGIAQITWDRVKVVPTGQPSMMVDSYC